jgi:hypothetical protein
MRLMSQLPFANRAMVVDIFVTLVAEQHGPADEADEALHHAGRIGTCQREPGCEVCWEDFGEDLPVVIGTDFADFGSDYASAGGAVNVYGLRAHLVEGCYQAGTALGDWLGWLLVCCAGRLVCHTVRMLADVVLQVS